MSSVKNLGKKLSQLLKPRKEVRNELGDNVEMSGAPSDCKVEQGGSIDSARHCAYYQRR